MYTKYLQSIMSFVGENMLYPILAGVFYGLYKFIAKKIQDRKKHSLVLNSERSLQIQSLLGELRAETDSDRTYIDQFHNGNYYTNKSPMLKISRAYEVCKSGVSHGSESISDLLVSNVPEMIDIILHTDRKIIKTDELPDCRFKRLLISLATHQLLLFPIKTNGEITAVLGIDYVSSNDLNGIEPTISKYTSLISERLVD